MTFFSSLFCPFLFLFGLEVHEMPSFFEWEWSATTNFFSLAGVDGWILCWLHVVCPGMFVGGWVPRWEGVKERVRASKTKACRKRKEKKKRKIQCT